MRIFDRAPRQAVTIGTDITVTVIQIRGRQVRLGVNAPREVSIQREEIIGAARVATRRSDSDH